MAIGTRINSPFLRQAIREISRNIEPERKRQFAGVLLLTVLGSIAELATFGAVIPFLAIIVAPPDSIDPRIGRILDFFGIVPPDNLVVWATGILIVAAVAAAIIRLALTWISKKFIFGVGYDLGSRLYARALQRPYIYYATHNSSEILSGVTKVQVVLQSVVMPGIQLITSGGMALVIIGGLIAIDPVSALAATAAFAVLYGAVSLLSRRTLRRNSRIQARAHTSRLKSVQEGLGGIRDVILDRSHNVFLQDFRDIDRRMRDAQATNQLIGQSPRFVVEAFGVIVIALLALYLSGKEGGLITAIPILGALAFGAQRLMPLVQQVYLGYTLITGNEQNLRDVIALLDGPPMDPHVPTNHKIEPLPFKSELRFEDVAFRYPGADINALSELHFAIRKGERIGFIGQTGSGKTTLMDLAMGLLEPTSGAISVDGTVLDDSTRAAWQAQVAHVPQAIFLADTSIARNIAFGEPAEDIDMERIREAAQKADIHAFIASLPEQYETSVGERGVRLSGGQRQRIGIARALYKRATVLVLDEATSALDDATELAVMDAINGLSEDLTILMIAHRLTTVESCDRIVRLEKGRIEKIGSFAEVIETTAAR